MCTAEWVEPTHTDMHTMHTNKLKVAFFKKKHKQTKKKKKEKKKDNLEFLASMEDWRHEVTSFFPKSH